MEYSKLDSEHEIRVLCVRSRSFSRNKSSAQLLDDAPVYCELRTVRREDKPEYDALSYVWGDKNIKLPIQVNYTGKPKNDTLAIEYVETPVTENLCLALRHLRDDELDVTLWVDAICINQQDTDERGAQVKRMTDVYASSRRTRVWLGLRDSNSDEAIIKLAEIGKAVIARGAFDLMFEMNRLSTENPVKAHGAEEQAVKKVEDMLEKSAGEQAESYDLLLQLESILSRPYWERVWILQEIVISPRVDLYCGRSKIEFAHLHAALLYIVYMKVHVSNELFVKLNRILDDTGDYENTELWRQFQKINSVSFSEPAKLVFGMCPGYQTPTQRSDNGSERITLDLAQLLMKIRVGRKAKDARDRVFALIGMARDKSNLGITPNYDATTTCVHVYTQAARAIIASSQVDLLSFAQPREGEDDSEFPSWVPDW